MSTEQRVVCTGCGSTNRLPLERGAKNAKCGTCGATLFSGRPSDVGGTAFDRQVGKSTVPVVVDVWAPWCGPCRAMAPEFEKAAQSLEPRARFIKLNSDKEQHIASRLGIRSIPTLLVFKGGQIVDKQVGAVPKSVLAQKLEAQVAKVFS